MRSIVSSKEEWLVGLHELLNVRLRTVSFALAVRVRSNASVPLPLQNTQYLIDGIMWSVRDCVEWAEEAWLCFQSHLQACAKRYTQLCEQLAAVGRTRQCEGLIEKDELERERLYNIHAYLQDIYVAFCIVDAFLRHMNDESRIAKELAEKELPRLVAEHMPIWQRTGSYHVQEAVEDHRLLFLDLLRSWTATKILRADTQRRIEEHVRHRLKTLRDAVLNGNGRGATTLGGGDGVLRNRDEQRYTAISAGLRALMSDVTASSMVPISTSCPSKQSAPGSAVETARLTIASFTYAIFPPPRSEAGRNRCAHCGVILRNPNAKSSHYRYHFCSRNYQTDLKIVRLPYPSMEDYVTHVVDCGETGSFVRVTQDMLEVLRAPDKQIVHVRRNVDFVLYEANGGVTAHFMFGTGALCRSALAVLKLDEEKLHSLEDIKAAFHRQAKKVHPDVGGNAQAFRELHDAYRYLHDAINECPTDAISNFCGRCGERREKSTHNYGFQGKSGSADEEDFSASENANYSTRDFYRPYVFHQFAHGFTHGEVHEANLRNYRHVFYLITKHMLLCGGLACLFIAYMKENRIQRAIDARNGGYLDISYWEKLRSDVWSRIVPPISSSWATNGNNELRRAWNCHLRRTQGSAEPLRQQTVISFCGRPFTAAGVRGARGTTPKPTATYEDDGHFELDDVASL